MGILNVTPDSFSDGGRYDRLEGALAHARAMVAEGAAIIDVGGESTRPGAREVSVEEELGRVIPVIEGLARAVSVPISIDTSKPEVMSAAAAAGAGLINDVNALRAPGALEAAAATDLPVCLMHMQGTPRSMQHAPSYEDVVAEVIQFLVERIRACEAVGISRDRIVIDPGFGFGKTLEHNLALLGRLEAFQDLGCPILIGVSRKSMFGKLLDRDVDERLPGSLAACVIALGKGASIVRAHDVAETQDAVAVFSAIATLPAKG
ncbi:MAG: dihydropteroate synthase [Xanthomonadales bacterium]|nr:dihydropteroate synthase [Xanthomonadales bacterium]